MIFHWDTYTLVFFLPPSNRRLKSQTLTDGTTDVFICIRILPCKLEAKGTYNRELTIDR